MTQTAAITRPELTMPEAEAELLRAEYARADVILEYGTGGSTALASELSGKTVFAVESDKAWAEMMRAWLAENAPATETRIEVIWCDVGETGEWGRPVDDSGWRRYPRYALQVWQRADFQPPDVVLVDGRFREGCALACAFLAQKPLVLLFDDYAGRQHYHHVEEFLGVPELTGRMARFEITPQAIPPERLLRIMQLTVRP